MHTIDTEVLVIGGGATGTGVARDLAMRGFKTILLEKGDLTHGTTGRYHGLLHSGGRYVVKDPAAARECIAENRILRRILPHCIEDTGGFFVVTPWDDPDYAARFVAACHSTGVPVEEVPISQMLKEEPLLNPHISHCFRVPDGSADSFLAADANAESIRQHGGQVLPYHKVLSLIVENGRVRGAHCLDMARNEELTISADMVVNATGAWSGQIAASAGITVKIIPGKGTMLAINHRILNTVVNRCKMPSDGDIIVPAHTVAVVGTTDVPVADPDHYAIEPWEVQLMLEEGDKMVPGLKDMRLLRAWAGVRPLYQETAAAENRDVTRAFVLLDHEIRDGVPGLLTITGGKWTTYRKMAEVTVDLVGVKLGVERSCRTHLEELPGASGHGSHYLGMRLAQVEKEQTYGRLVCECELATYEDIERAITTGNAVTIDDVRRDARLGMGPCQGGFCTIRVAGILHRLRRPQVESTNAALRDFLQERWKGLLPILWGQQLRQERLDELIYLTVLGTPSLPGPALSPLAPVMYERPQSASPISEAANEPAGQPSSLGTASDRPAGQRTPAPSAGVPDVLVIGMGLAGMSAAWQAAKAGRRVRLVAKGFGATHWGSGCIDVLGYHPTQPDQPLESPRTALEKLEAPENSAPHHPYALTGQQMLAESLAEFQALCADGGYPLQGSLDRNWLFPTAVGGSRPTCLAPITMTAGDLSSSEPMLLVGFEQFTDFYPELAADNLTALGIPAQGVMIQLPALAGRKFVTGRTLAAFFDIPENWAEVAHLVKPHLGRARRVGFPAVLGWQHSARAVEALSQHLNVSVFEIPVLPPSIPGIRLHNLLIAAIKSHGGQVFDGMEAVGVQVEAGRIINVQTEAAARVKIHRAERFVLATGGILGGGILTDHTGQVQEAVFNLPLHAPGNMESWFDQKFLSISGHPIYRSGIRVGSGFQPQDADGTVTYENLYAAGNILAGFDALQERSLEGVALATGYSVGKRI